MADARLARGLLVGSLGLLVILLASRPAARGSSDLGSLLALLALLPAVDELARLLVLPSRIDDRLELARARELEGRDERPSVSTRRSQEASGWSELTFLNDFWKDTQSGGQRTFSREEPSRGS